MCAVALSGAAIDVRAMRERLALTQEQFAIAMAPPSMRCGTGSVGGEGRIPRRRAICARSGPAVQAALWVVAPNKDMKPRMDADAHR